MSTFNFATILCVYILFSDIFDTFSVTKKIIQDVNSPWLRRSITTCLRDAFMFFIILDGWRTVMSNLYTCCRAIFQNINAKIRVLQNYCSTRCNRPFVRVIFNIFALYVVTN